MPVLRVVENRYVGVIVRSSADDSCAAKPDDVLRGDIIPTSGLVGIVPLLPGSVQGHITDLGHSEPLEEPLGVGLVHPEVIVVDVDSSVYWSDHAEGTETLLLLGLYLRFLVANPEQAAAERGCDNQKREHQ